MPKVRNPILYKNDQDILRFLWRHKIATFQALKTIFFPKHTAPSAYYRLRALKYGGLITMEKIKGTPDNVWLLAKGGFQYLNSTIMQDEITSRVYRPYSLYHDLVVMSALLGDWYKQAPDIVRVVSEQELTGTYIGELPTNLRKSLDHKPDGLWIFKNGKESKAIALEVEMSTKAFPRYEKTCAFYTAEPFFDKVIWIVEGRSAANKILDASRSFGIVRDGLHLFVEFEDFKMNLWQANILNKSASGATMADILNSKTEPGTVHKIKTGLQQGSSGPPVAAQRTNHNFYLDFGLRLGIPLGYKTSETAKNA
jgi:hypothetical protein